jgi:hypothetical protein
MVFKNIRDSPSAAAPTWAFSMSAFYVIQDHPVHIPDASGGDSFRPDRAAALDDCL